MTTDCLGSPVKVGDEVLLRARITEITSPSGGSGAAGLTGVEFGASSRFCQLAPALTPACT